MSRPAIVIDNLRVGYGQRAVLDGVSLIVPSMWTAVLRPMTSQPLRACERSYTRL